MEIPHPLIVWKHTGETLDQLLDRVRLEYGISEGTKITYAGRLDPIAEGIMILLTGEHVHEKDSFNKLDKYYTTRVVFGFNTDTYDVLGLPQLINTYTRDINNHITITEINLLLDNQLGTHHQSYPLYSSKTVNGIPLWKLSRDGNLPETIPSREITVYSAHITSPDFISYTGAELLREIEQTITSINGDFRQDEILRNWQSMIIPNHTYYTVDIDYHVSHGTYIRGLVHELGEKLETGAVILRLRRDRVGGYTL